MPRSVWNATRNSNCGRVRPSISRPGGRGSFCRTIPSDADARREVMTGKISTALPESTGPGEESKWQLRQIEEALRGLRFGTVTIIVQDGVIVQLERTEKRRFRRGGGRK